jgi:tripartite-type tricarboxylate transporter receptor subunit TctC
MRKTSWGRRGLASLATASLLSAALPARAEYPDRPVRMVIPLPPGGSNDVVGRILANGMSRRLSQPVVVENRSGASGLIAAQAVARAEPDGYTILFAGGSLTGNHLLRSNLGYDPQTGLAPISLVGSSPLAIFVTPRLPVQNLRDLQQYARRTTISYATSGVSSANHVAGLMLNEALGIEMEHVPYRGSGPVMSDLLAGRVQLYAVVLAPMLPFLRNGTVRAIALSGARRSKAAPDLPTAAEQGFPEVAAVTWYGLLSTGGTPAPRLAVLSDALKATLADQEVRASLEETGIDIETSSPAEFARYLADDMARLGPLFRRADVTMD